MSLLIPTPRDGHDAHGDLEEDNAYYNLLTKEQNSTNNRYIWKFEPVKGFFKQTDEQTDDMAFRYTEQKLGRLDDWEKIVADLQQLNRDSPDNEIFKLIFLARHGQAKSNVASQKYSKEEWMRKWRFLGTDGELTWGPDADLTELGLKQAAENHQCWKQQLLEGAPYPKRFYVSPLQRLIKTHNITWPNTKPIVLENLRETIGLHLCHKRSNKSSLKEKFPNLVFEDGFTEEDLLFDKYLPRKEHLHEQFLRINGVLQDIFNSDEEDILCITSHAGTIRAFITVLGHRKFTIPTGGMIPVVIKATRTS